MPESLHKVWIGCAPSNVLSGRAGFVPEAIVVHQSGKSLAEMDAQAKQARLYCSSHYGVGTNGEVHQYIEEKDTAFHAGIVVAALWKLIKKGQNPNLYTIGIDQESTAGKQPTDRQYEATAALISEIAARWKIVVDAEHVVLHSEIRAGAACSEGSFDRTKLLKQVPSKETAVPTGTVPSEEITLISNANVRADARATSRIVRVARAGTLETVLGFEDQGERISGNSCWYRTADGSFLWAGATDKPNPIHAAPAMPVTAQAVSEVLVIPAQSGIQGLDDLLSKDDAAPIGANADPLTVGAIHDLLTSQGLPGLPTIVSSQYGTWSRKTTLALQQFQKAAEPAAAASVDKQSLLKMLDAPAVDPRASLVYLTFVLGLPYGGLHKVLSLVAQMEGAGKFAALNRNTDRAGLSFGLIQWAQKPGRLVDILIALSSADRGLFVTIFGAGDSGVADGLVSHCRKPFGGVDPKTGETTNAAFDLTEERWTSRFRQSALINAYQQAQVQVALEAFANSYSRIRSFAPDLTSERGVAFMLDVANQWGNGGAEKLYRGVRKPGMTETDVMEAIAEETVARIDDSLKAGVRARREHFLQTSFLSDHTFAVESSV